ncbi:hypothetical protein B0H17DRAFT_1136398 [Mycena rosella]|uniref:Uncharacterized protein n=1 Tax=Mycena rosella TaxID=1033263 RepID=A0AAD7GEJ6_MYCRO|nr:hypothetical protein B0H17DRAFT_1136398 [Mycena rosella]
MSRAVAAPCRVLVGLLGLRHSMPVLPNSEIPGARQSAALIPLQAMLRMAGELGILVPGLLSKESMQGRQASLVEQRQGLRWKDSELPAIRSVACSGVSAADCLAPGISEFGSTGIECRSPRSPTNTRHGAATARTSRSLFPTMSGQL